MDLDNNGENMTIEKGKVNIKIKKKTKNPTMITTKFLAKTKNPQCTIIYKQTNIYIRNNLRNWWQPYQNFTEQSFREKGGSVGKWKFPIL